MRHWTLGVRCLIFVVKHVADAPGLLRRMLEDTDSEMLYQNALDRFEGDIELNM